MKESHNKADRAGRLAEALRANLQRRKAQARAAATDETRAAATETTDTGAHNAPDTIAAPDRPHD